MNNSISEIKADGYSELDSRTYESFYSFYCLDHNSGGNNRTNSIGKKINRVHRKIFAFVIIVIFYVYTIIQAISKFILNEMRNFSFYST